MTKDNSKSLVKFDDKEKILDIASFVSSAVPWVGGGISTGRKIQRVNDLLHDKL
jgi:hypothetical protein